MAKFSKQHYQAIAGLLKDHTQKMPLEGEAFAICRPHIIDGLAQDLAFIFERDNSRFSREQFLAVVRGERAINSRPPRS